MMRLRSVIRFRLAALSLFPIFLLPALLAGCAELPTVKEVRPGTPLEKAPVLDAAKARDAINAYRETKGLKPLAVNAQLNQAAQIQAEDLAKRDLLDHDGSDGSTPSDRVKRTGYVAGLTGENIAAGQKTWEEVLQGWKDSPPHNRNLLLPDATEMGIAVAFDRETHFRSFWALVLAAPLTAENKSNWE
ncbi:Cysteine-rich secretory protein family protein [Methyloligella halotolerans]|uniref:Cysteine-rich secretory protein family protein n=1 Tax=Methyloligella halotolerans TaxID=1177755 RepID=A0A1E2RVM9_9HYPH|nr:CAP domain-containing protein [Methyloligella halotolerans]ODA66273.1 Cysteine-rich secretory protein family protein [Methyloligella halotolerans]